MDFNVNAVLLERDDKGVWSEKNVCIDSIDSMKELVANDLTQVNFSKYEKVYFASSTIEGYGQIVAKTHDCNGETFYMGAPLLLVQCDDEKPIDISEEIYSKIKERLVLL